MTVPRRALRTTATAIAAVLALGCSSGSGDETAAWCDAFRDASEMFEEPETATPADQQEAIERGQAMFATTPPDEIADAVATVREGDELEQLGAAGDEVAAYAEEHSDGIDPALFEKDS
jgi:hypothetical protein